MSLGIIKNKECPVCKQVFVYRKFPSSQDRKYCSKKCLYEVSLKKYNFPKGIDHPDWKGDRVGRTALHEWLYRNYGKPNYCEHCMRTDRKQYDWANRTGKYLRYKSDWIRLCRSCHQKYDKVIEKVSITKGWRSLYGKPIFHS